MTKRHSPELAAALKLAVSEAALKHIVPQLKPTTILGIGSGTTVNTFIPELAKHAHKFQGAVAASKASEELLKQHGISVYELNSAEQPTFYIDSADLADHYGRLIKGGGGALTREKVITAASQCFIALLSRDKFLDYGLSSKESIPVEVIPMARGLAARKLTALGGAPVWRDSYFTDNGNIILDVTKMRAKSLKELEYAINQIPGVVENGLFTVQRPDLMFVAQKRRGAIRTYIHVQAGYLPAVDITDSKLSCALENEA